MAETNSLLDDFLAAAIEVQNLEKPIATNNKSAFQESTEFDSALLVAANENKHAISQKKLPLQLTKNTNEQSYVHKGDTDSSDDEENRNVAKYNDYGKSIKHFLTSSEYHSISHHESTSSTSWITNNNKSAINELKVSKPLNEVTDLIIDPIFGLRIVKPLVSSVTVQERMKDKDAVSFMKLKFYISQKKIEKDWVIAGVIVHKFKKTSQKGNPFTIWTLSDLLYDLKTVSLFLFGSAQKDFSKLNVGTVVGVLNPTIFDTKSGSKDVVNYLY